MKSRRLDSYENNKKDVAYHIRCYIVGLMVNIKNIFLFNLNVLLTSYVVRFDNMVTRKN